MDGSLFFITGRVDFFTVLEGSWRYYSGSLGYNICLLWGRWTRRVCKCASRTYKASFRVQYIFRWREKTTETNWRAHLDFIVRMEKTNLHRFTPLRVKLNYFRVPVKFYACHYPSQQRSVLIEYVEPLVHMDYFIPYRNHHCRRHHK